MADLNALIAQGAQFRQPESPLNMMTQLQQLQQGQSTNQLNQMKIAEAQRGMEEANALRRLDPTSASYLQDVMRVSPEKGIALTKARQEAKTAGTESQIKDVKLLTDKLATIPEMYKRANTPEDFLAIHQSVHSDPVLGPWLNSIGATPDKGLATLQTAAQTPGGLEQYRQQAMSSVGQILESAKPMSVAASSSVYDPRTKTFTQAPAAPEKITPTELMRNYEYAKTQGFAGSLFDYERKLKEAGRAPATPATPSAPVAVVDPVTGKQVLVSREEALRGRMTPAAAMESLPPKEIQKREAALPQATTAVTGFEKKTDSFVKDLTALRDHPGLSQITGIAAGRMPGITAEGRAAQALYDKVIAKGGFQALQDLRDASKTGGALGNVSNQEGKQLTASFSAIDRRQDAADVRSALDQAIGDVQGARTRLREAYDMTYSYKGSEAPVPRSPSAAPAAAPAANIDALLNKYK